MNHEIVGPEMKITTGQLRLPKREAIARHIAQYETRSMGIHSFDRSEISRKESEEMIKATKVKIHLEALNLVDRDFNARQTIEKELEQLGIPKALSDNWVERDQILRFQKLKAEAETHDILISIPLLERDHLKTLETEMEGMLKVITSSTRVQEVIRHRE
ncbi:MAG: hypothetical protein NT149_04020 [Candidatus Gottesmanbacteria bacterium]|nr:hypothetical protein [Candidatus Gottesmanbacteria bacterium]